MSIINNKKCFALLLSHLGSVFILNVKSQSVNTLYKKTITKRKDDVKLKN